MALRTRGGFRARARPARAVTGVGFSGGFDRRRSDRGAPPPSTDYWPKIFVFTLAAFIGFGVIARVSRLLHTPLMSLTNAISAIAVVGSIIVTGGDFPTGIRVIGAIALFASTTNIVSGFLITERMLKMFKEAPRGGSKP